MLGRDVNPDPERGKNIGRARARRQGAIAMFGNGDTGARDDESGASRYVDRAGAVAAGADDVDRFGRRLDPQHLGAHRQHCTGDFLNGLAAHAKGHQQSPHLRGRSLAGHHSVEGGRGFLARERRAGRHFGDDRFEVVHHVLSEKTQKQDLERAGKSNIKREAGTLAFGQLFAPVTCAKALWFTLVPISYSSFVMYSLICSSVSPRRRLSFNFFISSEARLTCGIVISVTRKTIQALAPTAGACPALSLAVRKAAVMTLAGRPDTDPSRFNPLAVSTLNPAWAASSASLPPCSSFWTMSVAFVRSRLAIWSSRHFASTWSLTSSRLRSRVGVMPRTSYQTYPPPNEMGSLSTPTSLLNAWATTSRPRGMLVAGWPLGRRPERSTASTVTALSPSFFAASMTLAPPPRSSSILSRSSATLERARSFAISFFISGATFS